MYIPCHPFEVALASLQTKECLSLQDRKTFKIKIKKNKICWKFRRKSKKYQGWFSLKEFDEQRSLILPADVCNENPHSGY